MSVPTRCYGRHDLRYFSLRVHDFDDKVVVRFVVQPDDYRVVRVMHVVKDTPAMLVESTGCNNAGYLSTRHPQTVPPTAGGLLIDHSAGDVGEWDLDLALERPDFIQPLNVEDRVPVDNGYLDQQFIPLYGEGVKIRLSGIEGNEERGDG